jgi:hypothetical protein
MSTTDVTVFTREKSGKQSRRSKKKKGGQISPQGDVRIPRLMFEKLDRVYRFRRHSPPTSISQVALTDTLGAFTFTLNVVNGYTEFTTLFDSYRIAFLEVKFHPIYSMQALSTSALITPRLITAIDLDDATTPGTLGELAEYGTQKQTNFNEPHVRTIAPRAAKALYGGGAFTSYGMAEKDLWVDCNSPSVAYYALKYGVEAGASGQTALQSWRVEFIWYLEFRYSR